MYIHMYCYLLVINITFIVFCIFCDFFKKYITNRDIINMLLTFQMLV